MTGEETVYVLPRRSDPTAIHTDPDCWVLGASDRDAVERSRSSFTDDRDTCSYCSGETAASEHGKCRSVRQEQAVQERIEAVRRVLREAGRPLSRRDIQLEALLSEKETRNSLSELREAGELKDVANHDDGRIPLYQLVAERAAAQQASHRVGL